jgi:hypothetical protein
LENRNLMMQQIGQAITDTLNKSYNDLMTINCHHNYIAWENHFGQNVIVTRKGAGRARKDDMGIIPGSMGARTYVVRESSRRTFNVGQLRGSFRFRFLLKYASVRLNKTSTRQPDCPHCSFAYSALACFRMGMSGSASFHSVRKSL